MKKIILFISCSLICLLQLNAQEDVACIPDPTFADSAQVVFPLPLDPNTGEGGIEMFPACIGEPYELVFSFRVGDSTTFNGLTLDLIRAEIATTDAVAGLPEGVNYFCNPPNCVFPDTVLGCIVLRGTPTENNTPGVNSLIISASIVAEAIGTVGTTIPGPQFTGEFNLVLNEMGGCESVSTNDYLAQNLALANIPNPVVAETTIEVSSDISGDFQFSVFDVAGKLMHSEQIQLTTGFNSFVYNASDLEAGMYIYAISNGTGAISEKMIVSRR